MKKLVGFVCLLLFFTASFSQKKERLIDFVDPFIGTGGHGHTYPGPALPFGLVQLSPDNGTQGWDWCSGYHYSDSIITGFSHTHLSGTGIGDLADISVMPSVGKKADTLPTPSKFLHSLEKASPGYYQVMLQDYGINAEFTTGLRCGFHQYTFPQSNEAMIRLDLGFAINWDSPVECYFKKINDSTYAGYRKSKGWAPDQWVFFALRLDKKIDELVLFNGNQRDNSDSAIGKKLAACLKFKTAANEKVHLKVGLSFATIEGAIASLDEIQGWDFNRVRTNAEDAWESALSAIKIKTSSAEQKRIFYTAFYHTCQAPVLYSDSRGQYKSTNGKVVSTKQSIYTVHSLWDTFRAENPLLTITQPDRVPDIINSYITFYRQSGLLPVWDLHFNETNCMTGYHCVPVITDAIFKNIKGFDYEEAYNAMKASSMQNQRGSDLLRRFGYIPQDKMGYSVTITLEYAFDDWCIAQVARKLGHKEDFDYYTKRAANYANLFDSSTGFFRAKNSDGNFVTPFDSYYSDHTEKGHYIEGTAWQHTFFVPHAVNEYAKLLGGKDKLVEKLDSLFTTTSVMHGENVSNDISGLIGQYAHGNEPSHHIAYMYAKLGKPAKTAQRVKQILTTLYHADPNGLSGNEDCGQMSAWYVWSSLGFYPMNPATGEYVFGYPLIDEAIIKVPGGKTMKVAVTGSRSEGAYVKSVKLNGRPHSATSVTHQEIVAGGNLQIILGTN